MRFSYLGLTALALLALILPALHNGFPLMFHDSGAYLERAFARELEPGRSPFYGFFIVISGGRIALWLVVAAQALATIWLIALTLRLHSVRDRRVAALVTLFLAATTTLAWGVATIMPDAFTPLAVLAWYILVFERGRLGRVERVGVALLLLLALLVHSTHLALVAGLLLVPGLWLARQRQFRDGLVTCAAILGTALLLLPLVNGLVSDRFGFTPGGQTFIFGRLLQSGMVQLYLDEHCPSSAIRLCAYQNSLPTTGDEWIWDSDSPFQQLGGWEGFAPEMRQITLASLAEHPWRNASEAAKAGLRQFFQIGTGEDFDSRYWHTDQVIARYLPDQRAAHETALQHRAELGWRAQWLNRIYLPVTFAAILLLSVFAAASLWRRRPAALPCVVLLALFGNAAICGIFSGPHDRYQGRIAWLAVFALLVLFAERRSQQRVALPSSAEILAS